MGIEVPFQHTDTLWLLGPQGEIVRVAALFDGCAMVAAMCVTVFEKVKHRLGKWDKSDRQLRMGNGVIVPSLAVWRGKMQLGKVTVEGGFEVFDSGGSWAFFWGNHYCGRSGLNRRTGQIQSAFAGRTTKKKCCSTR